MKNINLKKLTTEKMEEQSKAIDAFPWESREAYIDWLAQTYYFVSHSTRLLALAAARFQVREDSYHLRFLEHLKEEKSHEKLCLADMKAMDARIEDYPEHPETRAFYQAQYYLVEHVSPKALFGYILSLEALAASKGWQIYRDLCKHHGAKSAVFMKVHCEEDIDHVEKLQAQLDTLQGEDKALVAANLEQSCVVYTLLLDRIKKSVRAASSHNLKRAA